MISAPLSYSANFQTQIELEIEERYYSLIEIVYIYF